MSEQQHDIIDRLRSNQAFAFADPVLLADAVSAIRDLSAELSRVQTGVQGVTVDMFPPATARDRWMYEQGRLAERDPRTHAAHPPAAPAPTQAQPAQWRNADAGVYGAEYQGQDGGDAGGARSIVIQCPMCADFDPEAACRCCSLIPPDDVAEWKLAVEVARPVPKTGVVPVKARTIVAINAALVNAIAGQAAPAATVQAGQALDWALDVDSISNNKEQQG